METLEITSFNTIKVKNHKNREMPLEDFVRKLEKKAPCKKYSVEHNVNNSLYVIFQGEEFFVNVNKPRFEDCLDEKKCDEAIARLKRLADIRKNMKQAEEDKEKEEKRIAKIIEDAEKGIFADDESRTIYLGYLRKQKSFLGLLKRKRKETFGEADCSDVFWLESVLTITGLVIGGIPASILQDFNWCLIVGGVGFSIFPAWGFCTALRDYVILKKVVKQKIKKLEEKLGLTNVKVKTNTKTKTETKIETGPRKSEIQIKAYPYNFQDIIYKKASSILDMIDCLSNDEEKQKLKNIIKKLLQEYSAGLKLSKNVGTVELNISRCNNINELQAITENGLVERLGGQLDKIGAEISRMLDKQITEMDREKERLLLEERLGPIVIDKKEIDGVLEQREANKVPVSAIRLEKNGMDAKTPKRVRTCAERF